ncbi:hypothetical protein DFH09DRAFT_200616, partial [Mycena vulgaris]
FLSFNTGDSRLALVSLSRAYCRVWIDPTGFRSIFLGRRLARAIALEYHAPQNSSRNSRSTRQVGYTLWDLWVDTHLTGPLYCSGDAVVDADGTPVEFYSDVPGILRRLRDQGVLIGT